MPGAAELRERVTFDSPATAADDGYGNVVSGWTEEFTVYAAVKPLKGGEDVMAARLSGTQPVIIRVRYSSDAVRITPAWRARCNGVTYNLRAAANMDERKRFLDILAEAGVAV